MAIQYYTPPQHGSLKHTSDTKSFTREKGETWTRINRHGGKDTVTMDKDGSYIIKCKDGTSVIASAGVATALGLRVNKDPGQAAREAFAEDEDGQRIHAMLTKGVPIIEGDAQYNGH